MQKTTLYFTTAWHHALPSGKIWWSDDCISVEANSFDDALEFVGAMTNDHYQFHWERPDMPLCEAVTIPDDWKPCAAFLVCEQHLINVTLVQRFRAIRSAGLARILANRKLAKMREAYPSKEYFLAEQNGKKIPVVKPEYRMY